MTPTKFQKFVIFIRQMKLKDFQECFGKTSGVVLFANAVVDPHGELGPAFVNEYKGDHFIDVGKLLFNLGSVDLNALYEYVGRKVEDSEAKKLNQTVRHAFEV